MNFDRIRMWRQLFGGVVDRNMGTVSSGHSFQSQAEWRAYLNELHQHVRYEDQLEALPYVVLDTETTGFSPGADELLSVAAIKLDLGKSVAQAIFHSYVALQKGRIIPESVQELTGITHSLLEGAPDIDEVLLLFLRFIEDRVIVAHHAGFDVRFLNVALRKKYGIELDSVVLDTGKIAMLLHPFKKYPTLDWLLALYEIPIHERHSAEGDALMTLELFCRELQQLKAVGISTLGELWERLMWLERTRDS